MDRASATASLENLYRLFTVPESAGSVLGDVDREISENLAAFLRERIVAQEKPLEEIERDFSYHRIPEQPLFVSDYTEILLEKLVAQSVHTTAPGFIGHMATPLPYFMLPMARIMTALNQNLVKIETSKAFTPLERQVMAMLHHLVYQCDEGYYHQWMHDAGHALGVFCSGGTIANLTALWVARNRLFAPTEDFTGIARTGVHGALQHHGHRGLAVLVSRRGHYSLGKAVDVLGLGRDALVSVETDPEHRIDTGALYSHCEHLNRAGIKVLAIVGIAGTTETGSIDPLDELADIARDVNCHFHVDAAWGGPTLFSDSARPLLKGIERADSVTIDAHKQLYVPMGSGMVMFRDPSAVTTVEHHAEYILRRGSKDLGAHTLEGSRPGMAMLVHAGFHIFGKRGYEILIDRNIERAREFAALIEAHPDFELVSAPTLNILTYRYAPAAVQAQLTQAGPERRREINAALDEITQLIQKLQRAAGKSFVSRTRLNPQLYNGDTISVFRVVLANPLTDTEILQGVLEVQQAIGQSDQLQDARERLQ